MINATENIADLESRLERATLMEEKYINKITSLQNELAEMYDTLWQQETRLAELTENISCHLALPFTTSQRLTAPSTSHQSHQNPYGIKPKNEKEIPGLGPATIEFTTAQNLTHFHQFISLIVTKNSPTKWSTMLGVLSLPDNVRKSLLHVLMTDLERRARNY